VAGQPGGDGDVVGALQALGYSLGEAREAARIAIAGSKVGDSLEDRVKTALRALARD
jgi:Holliday junction resolvasome RuvABC DNA-binding subunit